MHENNGGRGTSGNEMEQSAPNMEESAENENAVTESETPTNESTLEGLQLTGSSTVESPLTKEVRSHPLSPSPDSLSEEEEGECEEGEGRRDTVTAASATKDTTVLIENSEAFRQVCATFSTAMAHAAYVPFCRLLGQFTLNDKLYNTELIESIAYSHDQKAQPSPLQTIFDVLEEESEASSDSKTDEDSEDDLDGNLALKLGPVAAISGKSGLGGDSASFGKPLWFVKLNDEGDGMRSEEVSERVCRSCFEHTIL